MTRRRHDLRGLDRRRFLVGSTALGAGAAFAASAGASTDAGDDSATDVHPSFPRQDPRLVEEVVRFAHFDLAKVQERVERQPALARAAWDWGFGDWETALGAASHTGQRQIAEYLISMGARPTLFSAAMLGRLDVVRAFVGADPAYLHVDGPHGIPLVAHARAGGEEAAEVLRYLEKELEKAPEHEPGDEAGTDDPFTPADRTIYKGTYRFGSGDDEALHVGERRGVLNIRRGDDAPRTLHPVSEHVFHPVGAEAVRIVFAFDDGAEDGRAVSLAVHDPEPVVVATRE